MSKRELKKESPISLITGNKNWAVFISGQGSNLRAFSQVPHLGKIQVVVSSSAKAPGLLWAKRYGIPSLVLPKPINWDELDQTIRKYNVERIFLLGFMRLIPESFVNLWVHRILNLHPSWLPKYPGLKSVEQAVAAQDEVGITVHEVTAEMDAGPRVVQRIAVDKKQAVRLTLGDIMFLAHQCEQRLVEESVRKWTCGRM